MSVARFIGWRYLKAKRKQTFISLISVISLGGVALGVAALIIVLAVMTGTEREVKDKMLKVTSHIMLMRFGQTMPGYREHLKVLKKVDGVASVEPFIYTQLMLSAVGGVSGSLVRGVDPDLAAEAGGLPSIIKSGRLDSLKTHSTEDLPRILLGSELAKQLGVGPGDKIKAVSASGRYDVRTGRAPLVQLFEVGGIFETGINEYDTTLSYISLTSAQKLLRLGDRVTGLEIMVHDIYQADKIKQAALAALGSDSFWAKDWMETNRNFFSALKLQKTVMFIILSLTILVAAFNIISTLIMVVMEKTRDIAILKSMGADSGLVMRIFLFQGLFLGAAGTASGLGLGLFLCAILDRYKFIDLPTDVYLTATLPIRVEFFDVSMVILAAMVISFLATLYPAWQASRLDPVEALRYE